MKTPLSTGLKTRLTFAVGLAALATTLASTQAAVILSLTDTDGIPTQTNVVVGESFTVSVTLQSTLEQTTGLTYFLEENGPGNPHLKLTVRDITGSTYNQLTTDDSVALVGTGAELNPRNDFDLGAGVANVNAPNGIGTFFVANLTLNVLPSTAPGTYTLAFSPNSIAAGPGPLFTEFTTTNFQYTVVATPFPEPTSALLLTLGGLCFGIGSRRRTARP